MKATALLLICAAVCSAEWTRMSTPNFELDTNGGERDARQTLETFEQVRDFFMRTRSPEVTTRLPVTIIGFRSAKDYKPYAINDGAIAYFTSDEQHDYIVMGEIGPEHANVAIHEYMHLLVRHSGLKMPIWLGEGFAEVYSTLRPLSGKILMGTPTQNSWLLAREKWLPLDRLIAVQHDSPEYNERSRMGILYSQSWLLTHMLMLGPGYSEKFPQFVTRLSNTGSTEGAFNSIYGKTLQQVEKDLRSYYSSDLKGAVFATKFEKFTIESGRPSTDLETELVLTKLSALSGRKLEAMARLERLREQYPQKFEPEEALGYLSWRFGRAEAAKEHLAAAIAKGAASWKTQWDFARLTYPDQSDKRTVPALEQAIAGNPQLTEARLMLGYRLYETKRYAQALVAFRAVRKVEREKAAPMFLAMAYSAAQLNLKDEALANAEAAKKHAASERDVKSADTLIQYVKRGEKPTATASLESDERPVLTRYKVPAEEAVPESPNEAALSRVKGRLTKLDCLAGPARLHLLAGSEIKRYLIRNPDRILIKGDAYTVNMTCGAQDTPLIVEFRPAEDQAMDTVGEVQSLEFIKPEPAKD